MQEGRLTLLSADGTEFVVSYEAARVSPVLSEYIDLGGTVAELFNIASDTLGHIVAYLNATTADDEPLTDDIPYEVINNVLVAADFLGI